MDKYEKPIMKPIQKLKAADSFPDFVYKNYIEEIEYQKNFNSI